MHNLFYGLLPTGVNQDMNK